MIVAECEACQVRVTYVPPAPAPACPICTQRCILRKVAWHDT